MTLGYGKSKRDDMNLHLKSNMLQLIQVVCVVVSIIQAICSKGPIVLIN